MCSSDLVSNFMENPGEDHCRVVKWVLWYLRGTSDHCISFDGPAGTVCRYVDADYVGDLDKGGLLQVMFLLLQVE